MKKLHKRWTSETPVFFKKVIHIGITAGLLGAAISTAPITLPATMLVIGNYLSIVGFTSATIAKLTKI